MICVLDLDGTIVSVMTRSAMMFGDLLVVVVICKRTRDVRKAAQQGGIRNSLSALLFRNGTKVIRLIIMM